MSVYEKSLFLDNLNGHLLPDDGIEVDDTLHVLVDDVLQLRLLPFPAPFLLLGLIAHVRPDKLVVELRTVDGGPYLLALLLDQILGPLPQEEVFNGIVPVEAKHDLPTAFLVFKLPDMALGFELVEVSPGVFVGIEELLVLNEPVFPAVDAVDEEFFELLFGLDFEFSLQGDAFLLGIVVDFGVPAESLDEVVLILRGKGVVSVGEGGELVEVDEVLVDPEGVEDVLDDLVVFGVHFWDFVILTFGGLKEIQGFNHIINILTYNLQSQISKFQHCMKDNQKASEQIYKQIVYGNINFYQGKKADQYKIYRWVCYVRPYHQNEDLSHYIEKVVFTLHETFAERIRVIKKPPFEITEVGWGEFPIPIKIFFKGKNPPKPLQVLHPLALYANQPSTKKAVVKEVYDEIVFKNPSPDLRAMLLKPIPPLTQQQLLPPPIIIPTPDQPLTYVNQQHWYQEFKNEKQEEQLEMALNFIKSQVDMLRASIKNTNRDISTLMNQNTQKEIDQENKKRLYQQKMMQERQLAAQKARQQQANARQR